MSTVISTHLAEIGLQALELPLSWPATATCPICGKERLWILPDDASVWLFCSDCGVAGHPLSLLSRLDRTLYLKTVTNVAYQLPTAESNKIEAAIATETAITSALATIQETTGSADAVAHHLHNAKLCQLRDLSPLNTRVGLVDRSIFSGLLAYGFGYSARIATSHTWARAALIPLYDAPGRLSSCLLINAHGDIETPQFRANSPRGSLFADEIVGSPFIVFFDDLQALVSVRHMAQNKTGMNPAVDYYTGDAPPISPYSGRRIIVVTQRLNAALNDPRISICFDAVEDVLAELKVRPASAWATILNRRSTDFAAAAATALKTADYSQQIAMIESFNLSSAQ